MDKINETTNSNPIHTIYSKYYLQKYANLKDMDEKGILDEFS